MPSEPGHPVAGEESPASARDAAEDYRRLLARLASRAKWLGSRDPESAAQEALRRSLESPASHDAIRYYFSLQPPAGLEAPRWPLDRLFAWLHAVLQYVVREEQNRVGYRREVSLGDIGSGENGHPEPGDPTPSQLDALLQRELQEIVGECFPALDREYQRVLRMRAEGLKYDEIARRLGVNENTVATWVSRGIRELGVRVRRRLERSGVFPRV